MSKMAAVLLYLSLLISGCTKQAVLAGGKDRLRFPLFTEPLTLDTAAAQDEASLAVLHPLMHGLTKRDNYGRVLPALAERWEISKDGKQYTFYLRTAKWSDGVDVRAQDFVFAWRRLLDPKNGNPAVSHFFSIENAENYHAARINDFNTVGVKASEPLRLDVILVHADAGFLETVATIAAAPARQDVILAQPNDFASPLHLRTTGPYIARDWEKGVKIDLVANSYYYGRKPAVTYVELDLYKEPMTALQKYEKGELDVLMPVPATDRDRLKQSPEYRNIALLKTPASGILVMQPQYEKLGILVKPYLDSFSVDILGNPCFATAHFKQDNPVEP